MEDMEFIDESVTLVPGGKLFLYTDGVPEASNTGKEFFGLERTVEALNQSKDDTPQQILENMSQVLNQFVADAPQFDDMTMMCLQYNGEQKVREEREETKLPDSLQMG